MTTFLRISGRIGENPADDLHAPRAVVSLPRFLSRRSIATRRLSRLAVRSIPLLRRVEEVRGLSQVGGTPAIGALDDPRQLVEVLDQLVNDLEQSHRRLIETNVQLVSLREVAGSLTTTLDAAETTRIVLDMK